MNNDTNKYDYIVVGGGSSGATVAARLAENPELKVCLLEAGGPSAGIQNRIPVLLAATVPGYWPGNNWRFQTINQPGLGNRIGYQPRGKGLGGSSLINAMVYIRGQREDYDEWAAMGLQDWSYDAVLPHFKRSERNQMGANAFHGDCGPLNVANQLQPQDSSQDFVEAGKQLGLQGSTDFNGPSQNGVGLYQVTRFFDGERQGERCSTKAAYLEQPPNNLTIYCHRQASRLLVDRKKVYGVEAIHGNATEQFIADREVIICAGALQTPQLLMLSGIGDSEELKALGIQCQHHLPGVGKNLQDHVDAFIPYKTKTIAGIGFGAKAYARYAKATTDWLFNRRGLFTSTFAEGGAFIDTALQNGRPDAQLHFTIANAEQHGRKLHLGYGFGIHACCLRPESVGQVKLKSSNPKDSPAIDPNFFSAQSDLDTTVRAAKIAVELAQQSALSKYQAVPLHAFDMRSDREWQQYIRHHSDTIYHPVGTCKMGHDDLAVVDDKLRVHGLDGIRIADASVMPKLISGNTNAPSIMIGERAARFVVEN